MKRPRSADITLLIQGPLDLNFVETLGHYDEIASAIVLSCWATNDGQDLAGICREIDIARPGIAEPRAVAAKRMQQESGLYERIVWARETPGPTVPVRTKLRFVELAPLRLAQDFIRQHLVIKNNAYLQFVSTLAGLEEVDTRYVIKLRTDESYRLDAVVDAMLASPGKIVTNNVLVQPSSIRPFKISDHVIAGATSDLRDMFSIAKKRCESGDVFLDSRLRSDMAKGYAHYDKYEAEFLASGGMLAQQILSTSYLAAHGVRPPSSEASRYMRQFFDLVPNSRLGPYRWRTDKIRMNQDFVKAIENDPARQKELGVRVIGDKLELSSERSIAAGLLGPDYEKLGFANAQFLQSSDQL